MNSENGEIEPNYIKLDFSNKIKFINESDINEEESDLKTVIESFKQQITLEELNSLIYKLIPKNTKDIYKINIEQSKQYIKQFPFSKRNLKDSVNRILASDFKKNFVFNKQNIEDVSRILSHIFNSMKKFDINNEIKLKERIEKIKLNERDIFNMFIDIEMMNEKKSERKLLIERNKFRMRFYSNQNQKFFNSTGNLTMIHSLKKEENLDNNNNNNNGISTSKSKNFLYKICSSSSESNEDDEEDIEDKNKNKIKKIFKKINDESIELEENILNKNKIKKIKSNLNLFNEDKKLLVTKEYFIYPENNYCLDDKNLELPIELIILLKKFEQIKILTFQIRDANKKSLRENIFLLLNINLLFPNFKEIKIDLNDEELQKKIYNLYEIRGQELYHRYKKNLRIFRYIKDYKSRTINCWDPEGDINFIEEINYDNDIKYKYTSFGNDYVLGENPFEYSDYFGNNLKNIINNDNNNYYNLNEKLISVKYTMPLKIENNQLFDNEYINEFDEDESEDLSMSIIGNKTFYERNIITPIIKNNSLINLESKLINDNNNKKKKRKLTTPEILRLFIKNNETPFEMIFIYCYFLDKISNIKTLSLYFYDSFSLETELFLKNEEISFDGFHFLFFINKIKELNEVNFSFNSLDNRSFENILGIISLNKNISILRINFFTPDINFSLTGLLKLCTIMKLSLQNLFIEQIESYIYEKESKDLEMEYFIINHKLDYYFEKNICCLFNIIKQNININNYEEIVFRFDLPLLILSCDKYIIIIIKFIINILNLITFTKNKIQIFKFISPELILNGRYTPCLRYLFNELNNKELSYNISLKKLILQCKISRINNLFNICLNNIGLTHLSIGDLDLETFYGFLNDYKKYLDKMNNLLSLKIGLNNSIISYENIENKIKEFINIKSCNLKEKILFSFLELNNLEQINDLKICVQKSNIEKIIIQIGSNNKTLLNTSENEINEKYKNELTSLYYIMTKDNYKKLVNDKIIKNLRKYFKKNKHKLVVCKPYFSSYDF